MASAPPRLSPDQLRAQVGQGIAALQRGDLAQAEQLFDAVVDADPLHFDALHLRGVVRHQTGRHDAAVASIRAALAIREDAGAYSNLGLALRKAGDLQAALVAFDRALELAPDMAPAHNNRGNLLRDLGRMDEALAAFDRALAIKPDHLSALQNRGDVLRDCNRHDEALASYDRALASVPRDVEALRRRGNVLMLLGQAEAALATFDRLLAVRPDDRGALSGRGHALVDLHRPDAALASFERVLARDPDDAEAEANRANALLEQKRYDEAATSFSRVLRLAPETPFARGQRLHARMLCCDWSDFDAEAALVAAEVRAGKASAEPFGYQAISTSVADLQRCAEIYAAARFPPARTPLWHGERYDHSRIRLGYLSGEFRSQATSILMAGLFEQHDRERFELVAFDNGWSDDSELRARLERSFDEMVDITHLDDAKAAAMIHRRRIDILVNLNGYFGLGRQGIFAARPCPVQVNYLGFPGTLGADYIDYLIADRQVIPAGHLPFYDEQVVYLPECYQANDARRAIAGRSPSREEAGLPPTGFVFCCFNNNYKITPTMFAVWVRLLRAVDGSVLWLFEDNAEAARNLRGEAAARGVAPERLIFAPRIATDLHLARHRLADLFVDTLPYNAHTTASDALWAGLPVLTCTGDTFPGRVAGSLLRAAGLPELVTADLAAYEALALELATAPRRLAELKQKLARQRTTCSLFDTDRFRRHIEAALVAMVERSRRGEAPASFSVPPVS